MVGVDRRGGRSGRASENHFISSQRGFLAGPQGDQQASDDRHIRLNLDPVSMVAQQMSATKHVLEKAEKYLHFPAVLVDQGDDFRRDVKHVRGQLIRVEVQLTIVGPITATGLIMKSIQDGQELLEILEAAQLVFRNFLAPPACHAT